MDQSLRLALSQFTNTQSTAPGTQVSLELLEEVGRSHQPSPSLAALPWLLQQGATNTGRALATYNRPQDIFAGLLSISIAQSWAHPCTSKPQHLQPVPQSHRIHEISGVLGLFWCFTTLKHPSPPGPGREVQHKQPLASSPEKQLSSLQLGSVPVSSPHSVTVRQHGPKPPKPQQRWDVDPSHPPELSIPRR